MDFLASREVVVAVAAVGIGAAVYLRKYVSASKPSGTLYASPMSTCSRRVLMALAEAEVDYSFKPIDLHKGEQKSAEFLALQPYGKVPAWVDAQGFTLFESRAIMNYVAQGTALLPDSPAERALVDQWISVEYSYFAPALLPIMYMRVLKKMPLDEAKVAEHTAQLVPTLDLLEARLGESAYLAGASFTLADLTFMCYVNMMAACGLSGLMAERPKLSAWWETISKRPTWQYVMAQKFLEERVRA